MEPHFALVSIVLLGAAYTGLKAQEALIKMQQNKPDHLRRDDISNSR